jgi:hypothetical protein
VSEASLTLHVGEIGVALHASNPAIMAHVRDRYHAFVAPEGDDPRLHLELVVAADDVLFVGVETSSRPDVSLRSDGLHLRRRDFAGRLEWGARHGWVEFPYHNQVTAIESFLRIAYSFLALEQGGLLLHSAGVRRDGHGYIFPGRSGTGKSTIAGLATAREEVLSDEMVLVRPTAGGYRVHSTPFFGTAAAEPRDCSAPLAAGFLPVKDADVYLSRPRPADALARLLAGVLFFDPDPRLSGRVPDPQLSGRVPDPRLSGRAPYPPMPEWGPEPPWRERLLTIAADVTACIPFFELHFRRDPSFWVCLDALPKEVE